MIFLSIYHHKRSEAYHQTNRSNKTHMMGNGYWEWIIGECSWTWPISDRSLIWRTKISFRRINFLSSTSLPWKVAPSRSSWPPPLSHHLVCLSYNLVHLHLDHRQNEITCRDVHTDYFAFSTKRAGKNLIGGHNHNPGIVKCRKVPIKLRMGIW